MNAISNDRELMEAILAGGAKRQKAIGEIYHDKELQGKVIRFVQQNKGNFQDGQDAFHEGIIVLDANIRNGKFRGESSLKGYLFSICRLVWMNQLRKKARVEFREDTLKFDQPTEGNPEIELMGEEKQSLLRHILTQLGDRCKKILELWQLSYSMEEIAEQMDLASAELARKHKYRCHQSLMELLKAQPAWQNMIR